MARLIVLPLFLFQSRDACVVRVYQSIPGAFRYNNVMFCIEALHHMKVEMYLVKREKSLKKQECSCLALEKTVW